MSSTCVQGGFSRTLGGYQSNLIIEPHSTASAWPRHPIVAKQEPMDEDRNDSGMGSDFHSSSPGSEASTDYNLVATYSSARINQTPNTPIYYSSPEVSKSSRKRYEPRIPSPLSYAPSTSSATNIQVPQVSTNGFLYDESTSDGSQMEVVGNPLHRLQLAVEKNSPASTSASPPKTSEHSEDDENKSEFDPEDDEQGLRVPRVNSHGKVKTYKCKQCDFVAVVKVKFWDHIKTHIPADKLLTCTRCPFVTEFKHHLEYHLHNHAGSKPFKCNQCSYACVNKSMLNSHMKSHSTVYQYRCIDCNYVTKYCHSLKLHLRKYNHKPAMVLNADGTPNPLPIIDVYGTRRGPKQRHSMKNEEEGNSIKAVQNQLSQLMLNTATQPQFSQFPYNFFSVFSNPMCNPLLFPNIENYIKYQAMHQQQNFEQEQQCSRSPPASSSPPPQEAEPEREPTPESILEPICLLDTEETKALDLSKPEPSSPVEQQPKHRRKGRAFKLENLPATVSDDEEETITTVTPPKTPPLEKMEEVTNNNTINHNYSCHYCSISFGDDVLYTMHMGYHGYTDPFRCNMCGKKCEDKVSFFLHLARTPHN